MDLNELKNNPEQIKSLINILQSLIDDTSTDTQTISTTKKRNNVRENKFLSMPEKDMHKEDIAIDKMLHKAPPVARAREFDPIKVKCRICGKEEEVSPSMVYDLRDNRYKCNKCSTSAG